MANEQPIGYMDNVVDSATKANTAIQNTLTPGKDESLGETVMKSPARVTEMYGHAIGLVGDVIGHGVEKIYNAAVPEPVREQNKIYIKELAESPVGASAIDAWKLGKDTWDQFSKAHPAVAAGLHSFVWGTASALKQVADNMAASSRTPISSNDTNVKP